MKRTHVVLIALLLYASCIRLQPKPHTGLYRAAPPSPHCRSLSQRVLWLNLGAVASGALGGAASATSGALSGKLQWGIAGTTAGLTLTSAVTGYLATYFAAEFSRVCY